MSEGQDTNQLANIKRLLAANTLMIVIMFAVLGFIVVRVVREPQTLAVSDTPAEQQKLAQVQEDIKDVNSSIDGLRSQTAEIFTGLKKGSTAEQPAGPALNLPDEYVNLVNTFFDSDKTKELLSDKARKLGNWKFQQPVFIEPKLIYVDYSNGRNAETMMIEISIINYYDLRFNVIWDSLEAE